MRLRKLSSVICNNKGAVQPAHPRSLIETLLSAFLEVIERNFNFLASLLNRGDWFETHYVGNQEDRFSRVVASYISSGTNITSATDNNIKNNEEAIHQIC